MTKLNIKNRTIFCKDNLDILEGINSDSIDLIYLDPPFNSKKEYHAPTGSSAEGASFKDIFNEEDVKDEWLKTIKEDYDELYNFLNGVEKTGHRSDFCYLCYMAIRLIEMQRILKKTGSIYLHCDATMSHYLKLLLDNVFGEKNFVSEIIWHYGWGVRTDKKWNKKNDIILMYSKSDKFTFNALAVMEKRKPEVLRRLSTGVASATMSADRGKSKDKTLALPTNVWYIPTINSMSKERTGYPTQKPLELLHRIVRASSNEGDIILDPFCGCATTCVSAEMNDRKWIGIDVSIKAYELVKARLKKEVKRDLFEIEKEVKFFTDAPVRLDIGKDYRLKKWVYVLSHPKYKGEYKVGIAKYVESRLNSYQTGDPNRAYKIEYKFETSVFREIEKFIHNKFENKHEWVIAELKEIIKEIENYKE